MVLRIFEAENDDDHRRSLGIRRAVFVHEQGVSEDLEVADEECCRHFLAVVLDEDAEPGAHELGAVATVRLLPLSEGLVKMQRLAVLADWRGKGVGRSLVRFVEEHLRREASAQRIVLHAQLPVVAFYRRLGYHAEGPVFEEAGIEHRLMYQDLD